MNEWFSSDWFAYIIIGGVFLGGMVPMVAGIIHILKENRELDRQFRLRKEKEEHAPHLTSIK
jgi:hypothetical protein